MTAAAHTSINRRQFCGLGAALLGFGGCATSAGSSVPYSAGTDRPKTPVPAGATDCHMHFFDKRVATVPGAPVLHPDTFASDYRAYQRRIGTQRCVLVTPSAYGTNNQVMVEGMAAMGAAASRGVAVLRADVPDAELKRLHALGVRGVRFNLVQAGAVTIDQAKLLSPRLAEMGWHIQFHLLGERLPDAFELLAGLPSRIVFDHMGRIPLAEGTSSAGYQVLRRLIDRGNTWVKLSGPYMGSKGAPYPDASALARALTQAAPERMVWASDWPHATEQTKPDDAVLFDLLADWAPDAHVRRRILVDTPAQLYDFPAS